MKPEARKEARKLRKQGKSLDQINSQVDASRSRIYEWISDIEVTEEMKQRFSENRAKAGNKGGSTPEETKQKISEAMKENFANGELKVPSGNMTMRQSEKSVKDGIEEHLGTEGLKPEEINGRYADLCNEEYVIEVTFDCTKGINHAIERLNDIETDRKKILVCPDKNFGDKRKNRLQDTEHIDIENLEVKE